MVKIKNLVKMKKQKKDIKYYVTLLLKPTDFFIVYFDKRYVFVEQSLFIFKANKNFGISQILYTACFKTYPFQIL